MLPREGVARRTCALGLVVALTALTSPAAAQQAPGAPAAAEADVPMVNPPMVIGGTALGLTGLGTTALGVFLTERGSTLSCLDCAGASDDAPLVAGGLSAIILGLGMASSGLVLVLLGTRDQPQGLQVRTVTLGAGAAAVGGSF